MLYCLNPACSHPHNQDHQSVCKGCGTPLIPTAPGYLFQGRYLIVDFLGEEDNKKIYLAKDTKEMDEPRVIKKFTLVGSDIQLKQAIKQFEKTADHLSRLNHPQIAKIYDYFVQDNSCYIVEEYIEGKSLLTEIEEEDRLEEKDIITVLRELLPVLSYLHRKNIIYGKINLKNIIRPLYFFSLEEEAVPAEVTIVDLEETSSQSQTSNNVYYVADPWLESNKNQLMLTASITKNKSSESHLALPEIATKINPKPEKYENKRIALAPERITLGRGKKLVLMNVGEKFLFPKFDTDIKEENKRRLPYHDIYDLGIICIRLLTGYVGQNELKNENHAWLWREVLAQQNRRISKHLGQILDKMLQSSSTEGYQTAAEVIAALYSDISRELEVEEPDVKAKTFLKRRQFLKLAGWGGVGLISAVSIGTWSKNQEEPWENHVQKFSFETIKLNAKGQITKREQKQAQTIIIELEKGVQMAFVVVPGGKFMIGSPKTEKNRKLDENHQKEITISPFFMSKYPVTQAQWEVIMGKNPSSFKGANRPVEKVSWHDCLEFCQKLSNKINRQCRLPSEAEWEYATRAKTTTPFAYGATLTTDLANYNGEFLYQSESKGINRQQTTNVGIFPPNDFGLYDLHGNVWEWCSDILHNSYSKIPKNGKAWIEKGTYRVLRGGSWLNEAYYCRSANRNGDLPDVRLYSYGCRVVATVTKDLIV